MRLFLLFYGWADCHLVVTFYTNTLYFLGKLQGEDDVLYFVFASKQFDIRYQPLFIKRQLSKPFIMSQNSCLAESSLTCFNHNKTIWIA